MAIERLAHRVLPARWYPAARYHWYRLRGRLEPELAVAMDHVHAGDRVVDVGASWGVYTHALAGRGARVEAFEPFPECAAALDAYARGHARVHVHRVALSDHEGEATLHVPRLAGDAVPTWGSLRPPGRGDELLELKVAVRTLDSFALDDVRLVKIDVEGEELSVLRGAAATLARSRPMLIVEIEQRHHAQPIAEVLGEVLAYGYEGWFLLGGERRPLSSFDPAVHQREEQADHGSAGEYVNNFIFTAR
jgi:FkbM family methyltransferase